MNDKELNDMDLQFFDEANQERSSIGDDQLIRDETGTWRYANTKIPVPGAEDVTLTDRFNPKFIIAADGTVERVVISGESIAEAPELLSWCFSAGTPIMDGERVAEVVVPSDLWKEHDRVPGALVAPEYHGEPPKQELARAEREVREAEKQLEIATDRRAEILRRYATEMTRQEARTVTGLSVGRIQQLIRRHELGDNSLLVLELFEQSPFERYQELREKAEEIGLPSEALSAAVLDIEARGLIEPHSQGRALSEEGRQALAEARIAEGGAEAEAD
jgi:hypothetical protein